MNMLDYQKKILKKVSFSKELFSKELKKSVKWLSKTDFTKLIDWAKRNFSYKYSDIISNFQKILIPANTQDQKLLKN
jgi:ACT domain-containing protein